ncbi:MAG: adenylate/guanylate cyclase domain-containing protein [Polyangiales bacterium]
MWAPPHLSQHVLASRAALEGERKQVTVLFADLRGSLGVLAGEDPEDSQALLDAVLTAMASAVHRYEGAVNQVMGDGIMALFGAPIAHEDHALRAACAALAMQEAVRGLRDPSWEARGLQPQIRVGLHSGEVAVRTVRNDLSMDYRAVGQTTHIAARMEQLAPPSCVWLTADTYKLGQGLLRTTLLGLRPVKGVPHAIEVHQLEGISVRTRFQANALRGLSSLVGRQDMLLPLEAALADAQSGQSRAVVLCGEPGVGKSRLCYELLKRAGEGFRVLETSSISYLSERPHGLLASMVRALFGIDDDDDREQLLAKSRICLTEYGLPLERNLPVALELLDVPGQDRAWAQLDPVHKRRRIEGLVRQLLDGWCARGPSVLLCEDLHWCDSESLAFISGLVATPPGSQSLLLLTHRPELAPAWGEHPHVVSRVVTALDSETAEHLLANLLGPAEDLAPLRSWLALRTDGNPFFIEETARAVREAGLTLTHSSALVGQFDVPAGIEAILSARFDRLPELALDVLQAAAVLGDQEPSETLRAVLQVAPSEFAVQLDLLTRAELLYEAVARAEEGRRSAGATIRFKHALIQEVVYKRLVRPRKRSLHGRVVEVMQVQHAARLGEHVERLAEHAYRAELWARCAEYCKVACIRAASRGANALAIAHLDRGLAALRKLPESAEHGRAAIDLRLTALAALLPAGAHERLIELLHEAVGYAQQLQDRHRLARVYSQLSAELWLTGRYAEARSFAERALELVPQLEGDQFALEISARHNLAMVLHAQGHFAAARAALDRLLGRLSGPVEHSRLGWAGYPSVLVRTFVISVASMTGSFADAARTFSEGLAIAEQRGHAFSRLMIMEEYAMCLLVQGEATRAAELLQRALDVCKQEDVLAMYVPIATHLALALLELGQAEPAQVLVESVDEHALERAGQYAHVYMLLALSELQRQRGQLSQAALTAERAVQETEARGERGFGVRAHIQLADVLAVAARDPAEQQRALILYEEAAARAAQLGMPPWTALALQHSARIHASRRDTARAADSLARAHVLWTQLAAPARVSQVERLRHVLLGERD